MRLSASFALLAGLISALPIDSATSTSAIDNTASSTTAPATNLGKGEVGNYGPPRGPYDGGRYNFGPPPTPFPYQGGGYVPGQYAPPPAPRPYGNGYNGPASVISNGVGEIATGVGQLIGGGTAGLLGGVTGDFLHGIEAGAGGGRRGYRMIRRETEESAAILLGLGRSVVGWVQGKR